MSDQPKPTGEWTAEYVRDLQQSRGYITSETGWKAVADAHNAALAAEQDRLVAMWHERCLHLSKQLAAKDREIASDNLQLAAERERADKAAVRAELAQIALAAEREKVQALIVALKRMQGAAMDELPTEVQRIGDEVLAKVT